MTDIEGRAPAPATLPSKTQIFVGVPVVVLIWEKCMSFIESSSMRWAVCNVWDDQMDVI